MSANRRAEQRRDERHLEELRTARTVGDAPAEREAIHRLLEPYWDWARSIAYGRLGGAGDRRGAAEEVAQDLLRRLARMLEKKAEFEGSFRGAASENLNWAILDHVRRAKDELVLPVDPEELPEAADRATSPSAEELSDALEPYLQGLSARDTEMARDRLVFGLSPVEIAAKHQIKRGALDTAMHRIIKKMRQNRPHDVRK